MNEQKLKSALRAIRMTGLPCILRRFHPEREACVLMFHGFTDVAEEPGIGNVSGLHLDIDVFGEMCELLAAHYSVLPLDEVVERLRAGKNLPPRTVVLTFDDGYRSNYELAFPILLKHRLPATIFVATEFVDERVALWPDRIEYAVGHSKLEHLRYALGGSDQVFEIGSTVQKSHVAEDLTGVLKMMPQEYLAEHVDRIESGLGCALGVVPEEMPAIYRPLEWWQVREMVESGLVTVGGHTHRHVILGRCEEEAVDREVARNKALLFDRAGVDATLFAYPNGQEGDHNEVTREALIRNGYVCGVTTEPGFNGRAGDPMAMGRFGTWNSACYVDVVASGSLKFLQEARQMLSRRVALI